jgi:hypothetical protein
MSKEEGKKEWLKFKTLIQGGKFTFEPTDFAHLSIDLLIYVLGYQREYLENNSWRLGECRMRGYMELGCVASTVYEKKKVEEREADKLRRGW